MLPTNLFVDAPEVQDVSMTQLSHTTEEWPEQIIQKLKERIPQSATLSNMIKFMKKEDELGVATGSIVVTSNDKQAIIPIIIKDFSMYPMDVFIAAGKLLPLTPDNFTNVFTSNEAFHNIEEYPSYGGLGRFEDSNLWNAVYPPSLGRYAYASAGYDILDNISDTITEKDLSEFRATAVDNAPGFYKNGHSELIKKLANLRPVNMNEFRQGATNLIKKDIFMLRKEGPNKYTILANALNCFSPAITTVGKDDFHKQVSEITDCVEDTMNEVDQNGEKMLVLPEKSEGHLELGVDPKIEVANEFDHYVVKKKNGVEVEGIVIPKVIGLDMEIVDLKVFLGKTMSTIQKDIAGIRVANSSFKLEAQKPRVGQTGTFVYQPDQSHGLCTVPFTISSIVSECGELKLKIVDLHGVTSTVKMGTGLSLERIAEINGEFILPKGFKWIPMEGFGEITANIYDFAVKTAGMKSSAPIKLNYTGYDQFAIRGVEKYAAALGWDATNLQEYQTKFLLASLGAGNNIDGFIKKAKASTQAIIHDLNTPLTKEEKIAAAMPLASKLYKQARAFKCNLIKEASYMESSQTVDALLALNFINPENISKFVGKIPVLKSAISTLASLLIASRLGVKEIPEQACSASMIRLVEVVGGLEALRAGQQQ